MNNWLPFFTVNLVPSTHHFHFPVQYPINHHNPDERCPNTEPIALEQQKQEVGDFQKISLTREDLEKQSYLSNKRPWTEEQDRNLVNLVDKKKLSWEEVATKMHNRNKKMCYSRYRRLETGTKNKWSVAENQLLQRLVEEKGQNWKLIAESFQRWTPKQIKEHYKNYVRPDMDKSNWSVEDDMQLIALLNRYGRNWRLIEAEMPKRSLNQIKNRFFGKLKKLNSSIYGQDPEE